MSRLLARFSQYTLASLLLFFAVQGTAAEAPSTRLSLQGIHHLNFNGDVKVTLTQSDENSAYIVVDKGELDDVEIKQDDGSVWIGNRGRGFWSWFRDDNTSEVRVEIKISELNSIDASGSVIITSGDITSGSLTLDLSGASRFTGGALVADRIQLDVSGAATFTITSVQAKALAVDVSGASHVSITDGGTVGTQTLDASGASHYDGAAITTETLKADVSGASHAKVNVSQKLSADISGASSLEYSGEPKMQLNTSGASSIKKR